MAVKRLWFYIKLYPYFVSRSVQSRMSYKSDFILGVTASALMQALGYVFIWAVFQGIPEMNGWSFYQICIRNVGDFSGAERIPVCGVLAGGKVCEGWEF